jgi:hypothetical protein
MRTILAALAVLLAPAMLEAQSGTQDQAKVLLDGMRGANAMQCELALQGMNNWWNNGPEPGRDPAAWTVIRYAAHREVPAGSVQMLATALRDTDPCVRRVAARLLGRSELPAARARLIEATEGRRSGDAPPGRDRARLHERQDSHARSGADAGRPRPECAGRGGVGDRGD